ncbi:MAG: dephospho-CoA kinase [Daejeonella sp.]
MLKIGITGGIGSGKTTVCKVFELLGIPVFYADAVAKQLMNTAELKADIIHAFGNQSYSATGELNRKYIAGRVFKDEKALMQLNSLVHPAVFKAFDTWVNYQQNTPYVLKEAALLFESDSYKMCNYSVLVKAPLEIKIKRIMQRDQITEAEVKLRMARQLTDEQKEPLADFIVINDEQQLLIPQILALHQKFLSLKNSGK